MIRALYKLWLINSRLPLFDARGAYISLWRTVARAIEHEAHERAYIYRRVQIEEEEIDELFNL